VLVSFQCTLSNFYSPFGNILTRTFLLALLTEYIWNTEQEDIFLNLFRKEPVRIQDFEQQLYFDYFFFKPSFI
jgi:hypothetical protein